MDSNKQDAIDMLLFNNAFSGDLGQKARAFLERADVFGKVPIRWIIPHSRSNGHILILYAVYCVHCSSCTVQKGCLWSLGWVYFSGEASSVHWDLECEWRPPCSEHSTEEPVDHGLVVGWTNSLRSGKGACKWLQYPGIQSPIQVYMDYGVCWVLYCVTTIS